MSSSIRREVPLTDDPVRTLLALRLLERVLWTRPERDDRSMEDETRKGDEVQPRYRSRLPLIVLDQPPKAHTRSERKPDRGGTEAPGSLHRSPPPCRSKV
jgi:hypothetical protein